MRSDSDRDRLKEERKQRIASHYSAQRLHCDNVAAGLGQLILRTALVINGGALFVAPAFIALLKNGTDIPLENLLAAGGAFIAGIGSAALAAYFLLLHWRHLGKTYGSHEGALLSWISDEEKTDEAYRDAAFQHAIGRSTKGFRLWLWLGRLGTTLGFVSYLLFMAGCWFSAQTLLEFS